MKKKISKVNKTFIDWLLGARAGAESKQRRQLQLFSAFLIFMTLITLASSLSLKNIGGNSWIVMLGTSGLLLCSYFISRTRFHRVAVILAIILPAIPPTAVVILKPPEVSLTAELMWLALPLLVASLMLSIRKTIIVAVFYIAFIIILAFFGSLGFETIAPLMAYMLTSAFFVITITDVREKNQLEIENQLKERKHMEQELRESEEKFSKAFNASPQQIIITRASDDITLEVNDSYTRITGYTREETIGKTSQELGVWFKSEDNLKLQQKLKDNGRISNEEYKFLNKSGKKIIALISIEPIIIGGEKCWISILTDITALKQAENKLREADKEISKAFREIPEAVSITAKIKEVYLEANDSFISLTGYSREEVIGHTARELHLWKDPDAHERIKQLIDAHGRLKDEEFLLQTKSGEIRNVLVSVDVINFHNEPCLIFVRKDITKRKQMEEKLQLALAGLEHSTAQLKATNKELESFSYSVSHDLRSPLRSIDGFSQALLEDYANTLDEKGQDYFKRLRGASQKMGELIDGLLKLSRVTRSEMHQEKIDLSTLAKDIIGRLKETDPKRHVKVTIGDDLVTNGDSQMMRVLLENLLGNAWKFTTKTQHARIELGRGVNGDKNTFFIKDNGAGFDMAFKDKLFGAFQRFHDTTEFPGTGIGLATVQRIINRHGGSIRAEAEVGKGATFYFTFNEEA